MDEANLDAGESGNHDKVYQLTKHEFSSPGRGKSTRRKSVIPHQMSRCCGEGPIHHLMANVTRSNLTSFSITLNELTPGLQVVMFRFFIELCLRENFHPGNIGVVYTESRHGGSKANVLLARGA
ncbi:hypothetical protein Bca52824_092242 [Brassica carinata]|uniref:Uncharacterized protein n=3 Tax=Brassica TaxID=3705 RepID=A0A8X7TEB8_BRACI|nr:hypothetical protein Bca52824_092242 [Brassica carinata]